MRLLFLSSGVHFDKLLFLVALEGVFDGLKRAGFIVGYDLLIVQRLSEPLNGIIEFIEGGGFIAIIMILGEGDDVDKTCPVAIDFWPKKGAIESNHPSASARGRYNDPIIFCIFAPRLDLYD